MPADKTLNLPIYSTAASSYVGNAFTISGNNGKALGITAGAWALVTVGDALTTNPLSQFAATTSAQLRGIISDESGTGALLFAGGNIGAATATSINGLTLTTTTGTLTIDNGKTLTASNTLTLAGTDGSTLNVGAGGTLGTAAFTAATAYQPVSGELTAINGAGSAADRIFYYTGAETGAITALTSAARDLLDDTTVDAMRTTLGLDNYISSGSDLSDDFAYLIKSVSGNTRAVTKSEWKADIDDQITFTQAAPNSVGLEVTSSSGSSSAIVGVGSVAGAVGVVAKATHASAVPFKVVNSAGFKVDFFSNATTDREHYLPDEDGIIILGAAVDNRIMRGNGTTAVQASGWTIDDNDQVSGSVDGNSEVGIDVINSGSNSMGFDATASGAGAIGVRADAASATAVGVLAYGSVAGGVGIRAVQAHASAIPFQIENNDENSASIGFLGTDNRAINFPDAAGTIMLGAAADHSIMRGNGTTAVQSTAWTIDDNGQMIGLVSGTEEFAINATSTGQDGIGLYADATGDGGIAVYARASDANGVGVSGVAMDAGGTGIIAAAGHASAIPLKVQNAGGFNASITNPATAATAIALPSSSGTLALTTATDGLIRPALHGTYGDEFAAETLDAKWTRVGLVEGDHTYQIRGGSWMNLNLGTATSTQRLIHQPWTSVSDATIIVRCAAQQLGGGHPLWGPIFADSSGNGISCGWYSNSNTFLMTTLVAWAYNATALSYTFAGSPSYNVTCEQLWLRLRKSGTSYYGSFSLDGLSWGPETAAVVNATTMTRIGVGMVQRFSGAAATHANWLAIDVFNCSN